MNEYLLTKITLKMIRLLKTFQIKLPNVSLLIGHDWEVWRQQQLGRFFLQMSESAINMESKLN
jgi:hypothetical protein